MVYDRNKIEERLKEIPKYALKNLKNLHLKLIIENFCKLLIIHLFVKTMVTTII